MPEDMWETQVITKVVEEKTSGGDPAPVQPRKREPISDEQKSKAMLVGAAFAGVAIAICACGVGLGAFLMRILVL